MSGITYRAELALVVGAALFALCGCARHDFSERSALQLPVYPSAAVVAVPPAAGAKSSGHIIEIFTSWDSFDKVRDWYTSMLPSGTQSVVNEVRRQATYALFDDRRRSVHLEVVGDQVYIYLTGDERTTTAR